MKTKKDNFGRYNGLTEMEFVALQWPIARELKGRAFEYECKRLSSGVRVLRKQRRTAAQLAEMRAAANMKLL